jgi:PAS domain S-box-containing protein
MVSTHDADGTYRYASAVLAGLVGEYPGSMVGKHPRDYAHPDDALAVQGLFRRAVDGNGATAYVAWRCRRHDGQYAWLESSARATPRDAPELGAVICGCRDITERKQIEDALRDSEQRFRTTLETVRLVAVGLDTTGHVTFCNESLLAITGWTRPELLGESWFDKVVPAGGASREVFLGSVARGDVPLKLEYEILCRDGSRRTIEWDNTVLRAPTGEVAGTASLGADVTERRQEEETLKLLQSITVSVSSAKDLNGALLATIESLCSATGWTYGEAWLPTDSGERLERTTTYATPGVDAGPLIEIGAATSFAPGEGLPGRAWSSKSVEWFQDLTTATPEAIPRLHAAAACGFRSSVAVPVLSGRDVVGILGFFMDRPRATDERHTQMISLVAGQVGTVIERRRAQKIYEAEILRARDQAQAASHAKSDFLSRMSHELRTPLNSVIGFASVIRKNKTGRLTDEELTFLDRIVSNGRHLLALVNDVLDIAKVEAGRLTVTTGLVAVDELARDIAAQLEGQPRAAGVELRTELPNDMVPIESDAILLKQVLINLAGNALRFTHEGSVVVGATANEEGVPQRLFVRDTGIGIPKDRQEAIFEPFEQAAGDTHRSYGGTGLGLSISRAICDELGYRLTLDSEPGRGSTFTVHLTPP